MQNNLMLQARYRYLQARRDLEYQRLKEAEKNKELLKEAEPLVKPIEPDSIATCLKCNRQFLDKRGLSSHVRRSSCGTEKD